LAGWRFVRDGGAASVASPILWFVSDQRSNAQVAAISAERISHRSGNILATERHVRPAGDQDEGFVPPDLFVRRTNRLTVSPSGSAPDACSGPVASPRHRPKLHHRHRERIRRRKPAA
jgi:hypothetical protein